MEIYIDESGNLGKSQRYFVIAMIQLLNKKRVKNFLRQYNKKQNTPEAKGQVMSFEDRQLILNKLLNKDDFFISYIVLDKTKIFNKKLFEDKNILFNYLCSFLFRKTIKNCPENITLYFDNRTVKVKSGNSLKDYLKTKAWTEWNFQNELEVFYLDSKSNYCIQMVDIISNTIFRKYTNNQDHFYNQLNISESIRFPQNNFGQD